MKPRGHSNTSVVHFRDQRFSKHTLIEISLFDEKHPFRNKNFVRFRRQLYPDFLGEHILSNREVLKNDP